MIKGKTIQYKRWLRDFLVCFLALLSLVALFNCLVDGSGLFRLNKGLKYAATNLLGGKMVAGPLGGYDERKLQRLIVEHYPRTRDMIVVGSSRTMRLQKRFIHGDLDFFNHSMAGADLEDYVAILGLYRDKGSLPKTVVFSIDPWIFNKNKGLPQYWKSISRYYEKMVAEVYGREIKVSMAGPNKYMQLINLDYTRANYKYLRSGRKLYVTDRTDIDDFVREPDGSMLFPYKMRFKKDERSTPYSREATPIRHPNNFESLSRVKLFENFMLYLQKKEVKVILLLLPLHPVAYKFFNDNPRYQLVLSLEKYLRDFGLRNHIMLIGSYDPGRYQLTGKDFFDDHHGHEIVAEKVFAEYSPNH
ncbi:MAG: hypothetical protein ACXU9X_09435 [Thermodesulfobacteriota bacterium]